METKDNKSDSPCINVCQIDSLTALCKGCLRTIEEIAGWPYFSQEERKKVCRLLEKRRSERERISERERKSGKGNKDEQT